MALKGARRVVEQAVGGGMLAAGMGLLVAMFTALNVVANEKLNGRLDVAVDWSGVAVVALGTGLLVGFSILAVRLVLQPLGLMKGGDDA